MKTLRLLFFSLILILMIFPDAQAQFRFGDILKGAQKALGLGGELSENKIMDGLKEALHIGTENAVKAVSKTGGYYNNSRIRILLPESVRKVEKIVRAVGFGRQMDEFELSMNQAAEKAAPEAKSIFLDAIKGMTFSDARKILDGRENEATLYFKEKTHGRLEEIFMPIIHNIMSQVGVTRSYQQLEDKVARIPFTDRLNLDLDRYVTERSLDGLFLMIAEEERKIRQDPAARVTDLLKQVFGNR